VSLTFSLKYLQNFCKASGLSDSVKLCLSSEVPLLVEYGVQNNSYLRFYLAPKVRHYQISAHTSLTNKHRLVMRSDWLLTSIEISDMFSRSCGG
jgi:proliferating cell nuclear antigen